MTTPSAHRARGTSQTRPAEQAESGRTLRHITAIDGLRAVSVIAVLVFHANLMRGGFLGVDVFFVISGFLITSLLMRELDANRRIRLGAFYARRARRLLPSLLVVLAGICVLVYKVGTAANGQTLKSQGPAAVLYYSNWQNIAHKLTYWDAFGPAAPTSHLWSLAVEEQFYVIWPAVLIGFALLARHRIPTVVSLSVVLVVSGAAMPLAVAAGWSPDRMYLGTDTHSVGLVAGAVLASLVHRAPNPRVARYLPAAGGVIAGLAVVGVVALTSSYRSGWLYDGGFALVSILAAILIWTLQFPSSPIARLLSVAPLVYVGKLSYVIYLVHLPIYWALQVKNPNIGRWALLTAGAVLSLIAAAVIHHAVESPMRRMPWTTRSTAGAVAVSGLLVLAMTVVVPRHLNAAAGSISEGGTEGSGPVHLVVLGDSLANDMAVAMVEHDAATFTTTDAALDGCGIMSPSTTRVGASVYDVLPACRQWQAHWRSSLLTSKPGVVLIDTSWDLVEQQVNGQWLTPCQPAYGTRYRGQLELAGQTITASAGNVPVFLTTVRDTTPGPGSYAACFNNLLDAFVSKHAQFHLLDLNKFVCGPSGCAVKTPSGAPLTSDGTHLSSAGRAYLAPWIAEQLRAAVR